MQEIVQLERLGKVPNVSRVLRPKPSCTHQDDWRLLMLLDFADAVNELNTVHAGKAIVQEKQVGRDGLEQTERCFSVLSEKYLVFRFLADN